MKKRLGEKKNLTRSKIFDAQMRTNGRKKENHSIDKLINTTKKKMSILKKTNRKNMSGKREEGACEMKVKNNKGNNRIIRFKYR